VANCQCTSAIAGPYTTIQQLSAAKNLLCTLEWTFDDNTNGTTRVLKGKITFPDFEGTCELGGGYEMIQYQADDSNNSMMSCINPCWNSLWNMVV
jgi:hypothetical protein